MREFAKSMISFSWSLSLFGLKQATNAFTPTQSDREEDDGSGGFDAVTEQTRQQLGDTLSDLFKVGDRLQRNTVDMLFRVVPAETPSKVVDMASDAVRRSTEAVRQAIPTGDPE
jgi:hypothetical protein